MSVSYLPRHDEENPTWPSPPDPGDLSRRLTRRRAELHLTTAQVAARAGLSQRYVEYLERYPARPDAGVLRRLAAALCTSSATLLGGGASIPPGHLRRPGPRQAGLTGTHDSASGDRAFNDRAAHDSPTRDGTGRPLSRRAIAANRGPDPATIGATITKLSPAECRRLIAPGGIGRIAFWAASGPMILPVNYVVVSGAIVFRTGRGTLIEGHAYDKVAFEVDYVDDALCQGWSVLVSGQAHAVLQPMELRRLREEARLRPWPEGNYDVWVRIAPDKITGRRIESQ
jgi:nitroimidazol reductase NimA-like FMN-containing flavoprotein (pyridoxamine 5'-phosphate oxidase superfamily)/transcriptional regulator with XRE-family HTH domain